jgi:hypothetical protein
LRASVDVRLTGPRGSLHRALTIREKVFGPDNPSVVKTLEGPAKVCEQTGRAAEAQELAERAKRSRAQAEPAPTNPQQQAWALASAREPLTACG